MATRNLAWATGKRKISSSSHTLPPKHTLTKSVYRIYPDNTSPIFCTLADSHYNILIMGSILNHTHQSPQEIKHATSHSNGLSKLGSIAD